MQALKNYHRWVLIVGIVLNLGFIIPLCFFPSAFLAFLNVPLDQTIWGRIAGLFLLLISVFYIPAAIDIDRYRLVAWLAVFPSRCAGALFFSSIVLFFGHPPAFLLGAALDSVIGLITLALLIKIARAEQQDKKPSLNQQPQQEHLHESSH